MKLYDQKMILLLERLKEYDNNILNLEKELKSLNDQYFCGSTLKQQMAIYILMRNDVNYINERKILESKISLLRAERDKCYTDGMIDIQNINND